MPEIKKVHKEDFEAIYPLLLRFNEKNLTKEDWKKIFEKRCEGTPDYYGFYLEEDSLAVGYIGMIFSKRLINRKTHQFANLTSWIILDGYKNFSIALLFKVLKLKDVTFTAFTPNNTAYEIYDQLGFKLIEKRQSIIFPTPYFNFKRLEIYYDLNKVHLMLDKEELNISKDHQEFNNIQVLITKGEEKVFCIMKKTLKRQLVFLEMHYCSNISLFNKYAGYLALKWFFKFKSIGIIVESRFINSPINGLNINQKLRNPRRMYKGKKEIKEYIDVLYSELYFLHQ